MRAVRSGARPAPSASGGAGSGEVRRTSGAAAGEPPGRSREPFGGAAGLGFPHGAGGGVRARMAPGRRPTRPRAQPGTGESVQRATPGRRRARNRPARAAGLAARHASCSRALPGISPRAFQNKAFAFRERLLF